MTLTHPLLPDWLRRLEVCTALLETDPGYSWFWRVRVKILRYLILRYAGERLDDPAWTPAGLHSAPYVDLPEGDRRLPRSKAELRRLLEIIHDAAR